jgi:acyl-CoA synthetase (AMP-forming)/AMP-acid ligase II
MHLAQRFARLAEEAGARPALIDAVSGASCSFAELVGDAAAAGHALLDAGLRRGDRVALLLRSDRWYVTLDAGLLVAGLVRAPMDPSLRAEDWERLIVGADAAAVVFGAEFAGALAPLRERLPGVRWLPSEAVREAARSADRTPHPAGDASDPAALIFTGGTTSAPKAVEHSHATLGAAVENIAAARPICAADRFLNVRPLWPAAGITVLAQLLGGGTVVLGGRFDAHTFCAAAAEHGATVTSLVPTLLHRLVEALEGGAVLPESLQRIDIGAAAIHATTFARFLAVAGPRLGVLYGLSEAPWSVYQPPSAVATDDPEHRVRRMASSGRALGTARIRIVDADGRDGPAGEQGEIVIGGPHVMLGYVGEEPAGGEFRTGDLGFLDEDGVLTVTGRIKELIRTGGVAILPADVETVLLGHPDVADATVLGVPDAEWGEVVAAVVVPRAGASIEAGALIAYARERLPAYARPRVVEVAVALPRSHYGKVLKAQLRQQLVAGREAAR